MYIEAQEDTATGAGGDLYLDPGAGTTYNGYLNLGKVNRPRFVQIDVDDTIYLQVDGSNT